MSIYGSWPAPKDDHHEDGCEVYVETSAGVLEFSGRPCSCGLPYAPLVYRGSNILPSNDDERGGYVDIAAIPNHINPRTGRDDRPEDGAPWPFLRFGVEEGTVVLDRAGVELVHRTLSEWLERTA